MPDFRIYYIPDSTVFVTQNTLDRIQYLKPEKNYTFFCLLWKRSKKSTLSIWWLMLSCQIISIGWCESITKKTISRKSSTAWNVTTPWISRKHITYQHLLAYGNHVFGIISSEMRTISVSISIISIGIPSNIIGLIGRRIGTNHLSGIG